MNTLKNRLNGLLARLRLVPGIEMDLEFVGEISELHQLERGQTVLIGGHLVYSSLSDAHPGKEFVRQFGRPSKRRNLLSLSRIAPVNIWGEETAMGIAVDNRLHVGFVIDHYLAWGMAQTGASIVVGGYPGQHGTSVQGMVFNNGGLRQIFEKNLSPPDSPRFPSELTFLIEEIRANYPGYKINWAAPLAPLPEESLQSDVVNIGTEPFRRPIFRAVLKNEGRLPFWVQFGPGIAVLLAGLLVSALMVARPWHEYSALRRQYMVSTSSDLAREYRKSNNKLEIIQYQRDYMAEPLPQRALASEVQNRLRQIGALPRLRVNFIHIGLGGGAPAAGQPAPAPMPAQAAGNVPPSAAGPAGGYAVSFSVTVPAEEKKTGLEQGGDLLKELSVRLGLPLHLIKGGIADSTTPNELGSHTRTYKIEG